MKIGITGSIACGKSTITQYLVSKGYKIYDADKISYSLTLKPNICYNMIIKEFGNEILNDDLEINRQKLGEIVFNDSDKRKLLENIIHPYVIKEIENISDDISFVEVPLLFEANLEYLFDVIVVVSTSKDKQIERLTKRNKYSIEEAVKRIESQMDIKIKEQKADYVIYNNDDIDSLYKQIDNLLKGII